MLRFQHTCFLLSLSAFIAVSLNLSPVLEYDCSENVVRKLLLDGLLLGYEIISSDDCLVNLADEVF